MQEELFGAVVTKGKGKFVIEAALSLLRLCVSSLLSDVPNVRSSLLVSVLPYSPFFPFDQL